MEAIMSCESFSFRPKHLVIQHQNTVHQPPSLVSEGAAGNELAATSSTITYLLASGVNPLHAECKASACEGCIADQV